MKACYIDFDLLFSDERLKEYANKIDNLVDEDVIYLAGIRGFGKAMNIAMLPEPLVDEPTTKITYGPVKSKNARKKW